MIQTLTLSSEDLQVFNAQLNERLQTLQLDSNIVDVKFFVTSIFNENTQEDSDLYSALILYAKDV